MSFHDASNPTGPADVDGPRDAPASSDRPAETTNGSANERDGAQSETRERRYDDRRDHNRRPPNAPEAPPPSNVLGVFGLSIRTTEEDLDRLFRTYGPITSVTIVYDQRQQDRSRGFGFITMETVEDATRAVGALNGYSLNGRNIRVDYSVTERPHKPTPGEYMGHRRPVSNYDSRRYDYRDRGFDRRDDRRDYRDSRDSRDPYRDSYRDRDYRDRDRDYRDRDRDRDYRDRDYRSSSYRERSPERSAHPARESPSYSRDWRDRDREPSRRDERERSYSRSPHAAKASASYEAAPIQERW